MNLVKYQKADSSTNLINQQEITEELQPSKSKTMNPMTNIEQIMNEQEVEETIQQQLIDQQNLVSLKENPYKFIMRYSQRQRIWCNAIAINQQQTIMVAGRRSSITVFDFKEGQITEKQRISVHNYIVTTLYFMKKYNQFISGAEQGEIGLWTYNNTIQKYDSLQMLREAHFNTVNRIIMNKYEDLLISCSSERTIKFWIRKNEWECTQTLTNHNEQVYDICLNESCTALVSFGKDEQTIVYQQGNNQKWQKVQRIQVPWAGFRICFIGDDIIALQSNLESYLEIFQINKQSQQFIKLKDIPVNDDMYCHQFFPMQFNASKQLLMSKHGSCVNLIRKINNDFIVEQQIRFCHQYFFGTMTEDFKYLVTWDNRSQTFQVSTQCL